MGTLTLSDLKDELKRGLGNRTDLDARLTRFLNLAQERIYRVYDFSEMQQITTSSFSVTSSITTDKFITLPPIREIQSFRVLDGAQSVKLKQVSTRQWDSTIPMPEYFARALPSHLTLWTNSAELWPVPDKTYQYIIRWTKLPTVFVDSNLTSTS